MRYRYWPIWILLAVLVLGGLGFILVSRWRLQPAPVRREVKAGILYTLCGHEIPGAKVDEKVLAVLAGRRVGDRYKGWELVEKTPRLLSLRMVRPLLCPQCRRLRFLGVVDGVVAVYEGTPVHPGRVLERTTIKVEALPLAEQADLRRGIPFHGTKERLQLLEGLAALVDD